MAKAIKFNLLVNKQPIRDLDDLRDNFNLDDILEHHQTGLLQRWLEVRELTDLANNVAALSSQSQIDAARELCRIFYPGITDAEIVSSVYPLEYRLKNFKKLEKLKKFNFSRQQVIDDYHHGYGSILKSILENKNDYPLIKASMLEILDKYKQVFFIDFNKFFQQFETECILAILTMISIGNFRSEYVISQEVLNSIFTCTKKINSNIIKYTINTKKSKASAADIWQKKSGINTWKNITKETVTICKISDDVFVKDKSGEEIKGNDALGKLFDGIWAYSDIQNASIEYQTANTSNLFNSYPFFSYSGVTDSYWKDVEPSCRRFMVISMEPGNFVRNSGKSGEELSADQVNGHFPILDGIDYKSNNVDHQLLYMEI